MRFAISTLTAAFVSGALLLAAHGSATAATLNVGVDAEFTTIQGAVDRADSGDVLMIGAGTYVENVVIDKPLTVKSVSGPAETTVVAADNNEDVFHIDAANVTLSGFTVYGADDGEESGISLSSSASNCRITDNRCGIGSDRGNSQGIYLAEGARGNEVSGNTCRFNLIGMTIHRSTDNLIKGNTLLDNFLLGIMVIESDRNVIHDNYCNTSIPVAEAGIGITNSSFVSVRGNTCAFGKQGIVISGKEEQSVRGIRVVGNSCTSNSDYGLLLKYVEDSVVRHNRFLHSGQHGVKAEYTSGNFFIANSLANSGEDLQLYYNSDDQWHSDPLVWYVYNGNVQKSWLGNYYDDYSGSDPNDPPDGVGQGIYNLHGYHPNGGVHYDDYPLVTPTYDDKWEWDVVVSYASNVVFEPIGLFVASSLTIPTGKVTITSILRIGGL